MADILGVGVVLVMIVAVNIVNMDATQFQAAVLAWGAAATTLIGVLVALGLALRSAVGQLTTKHAENATAIAAVSVKADVNEKQLNGALDTRMAVIADQRIANHRRPGDTAAPTA